MTKFSNILDTVSGMRFIFENLRINSNPGRNLLLSQSFISSEKIINDELNNISELRKIISNHKYSKKTEILKNLISQIKDIYPTINQLEKSLSLDDVQLFEIKHLALLATDISKIVNELNLKFVNIPSLEKVIRMLDPDNQRIPHFYIYSSYSKDLSDLRKKQNYYHSKNNKKKEEEYRLLAVETEDKIRLDLSGKLKTHSKQLKASLDNIAKLDVVLAKTILSVEFNLCKPVISKDKTSYKKLFNPQIKELLEKEGKAFQPVDLDFNSEPNLITGANMTGKTVLLRTVALAQYLFQFGFFVPAKTAIIEPVAKIMINIDEPQSEISGLSSFATEILNVNKIIIAGKKREKILVLIDELARTTNPDEGKAIVMACIEILSKNNIKSLITTHYGGIKTKCRKLRVKGLSEHKSTKKITIKNINDYIDYSLTETNDDNVPAEAIKIAGILDVDKEFLEIAKKHFEKNT